MSTVDLAFRIALLAAGLIAALVVFWGSRPRPGNLDGRVGPLGVVVFLLAIVLLLFALDVVPS